MTRKLVSLQDDTYLLAEKLRGNKTFNEIIHQALNKFRKFKEENTKLNLEIEKLKEEIQLYKPSDNPKKEEWKKRIEAEANLPLILSDFEVPCYYRAVTSKGDLYCDDKKIAKEVCIQRQKRHLTMKRMCMPPALKKKRARQPTWQPKSGFNGDTQLWRG